MTTSRFLISVALLAAPFTLPAAIFQPVTASGEWFTSANWSAGTLPASADGVSIAVGKTAYISAAGAAGASLSVNNTATLAVRSGGTGTFSTLWTGVDNSNTTATITVDGAGSQLTSTGHAYLSYYSGTTASIHVSNGGSLQTNGTAYFGWGGGGAVVNMLVDSGGSYAAATINLGYNPGTTGNLTVTGSGSSLTTSGMFNIGHFGNGVFTLSDGATATNASANIAFSNIGGAGVSSGTALITGAGTTWNVGSGIGVGAYSGASYYASGSLTVSDGATVNAPTKTVTVSRLGTVKIGTGGLSGTLNVSGVAFGDQFVGTGVLAFNHTDDITFAPVISGYGQVTKAGAGTVTFTGANTYVGGTTITGGTIRLGGTNALGRSTTVLNLAGGTLDLNGFNQQMNTLNVTANSTLNFGGTSTLFIYNSTAADPWTGTLTLTNFTIGTNNIYVGSSVGFTAAQLEKIQLAGYTASINGGGYLTFTAIPIPEPAACATLLGTCALGLAVLRRRQK